MMLEVTARYSQHIYRTNTQRVPESMASRRWVNYCPDGRQSGQLYNKYEYNRISFVFIFSKQTHFKTWSYQFRQYCITTLCKLNKGGKRRASLPMWHKLENPSVSHVMVKLWCMGTSQCVVQWLIGRSARRCREHILPYWLQVWQWGSSTYCWYCSLRFLRVVALLWT